MIGLDTNVLVRYLVKDHPAQGAKAAAFIRKTAGMHNPLYINSIVLCELVWVLRSAYRFGKSEIASALELILSTEEFELENLDDARLALEEYRKSKADFSDCLIGIKNRSSGCDSTVTFDDGVKDLNSFRLL